MRAVGNGCSLEVRFLLLGRNVSLDSMPQRAIVARDLCSQCEKYQYVSKLQRSKALTIRW